MKKVFYGLITIFACLLFANKTLAANTLTCHYKQETLGIEFDVKYDTKGGSEIGAIKCNGKARCIKERTNGFTLPSDMTIGSVNLNSQYYFRATDTYLLKEYYINKGSSLEWGSDLSKGCPTIALNYNDLTSTGSLETSIGTSINMDASIPLTTVTTSDQPKKDYSCSYHGQDLGFAIADIEFYKMGTNYAYQLTINGNKTQEAYMPGTYISVVYNGTTYYIAVDSEAESTFKGMLRHEECLSKLYVYKKDEFSGLDTSIVISDKKKDNSDFGEIVEENTINELYGALKNPLSILYDNALSKKIKIYGKDTTLNNVASNNKVCTMSTCSDNPKMYLVTAVKNMDDYCYSVTDDTAKTDCQSYWEFREYLQENIKIEKEYTSGCSLLSNDMAAKLKWVLDLIKIIGPIIAIALGTLDFIKAIVSEDPDKGLKDAAKRFKIRIIAAVLLFLVPFILAVLMDTFLKNKAGYNPNNPFCNVVDWKNS